MTTEEKNKVLEMSRSGRQVREIAKALNLKVSTVQYLFEKKDEYVSFALCLNCGKEFVIKIINGRPRKFCSTRCRLDYNTKKRIKNKLFKCKCCGKEFLNYGFRRSKFCSSINVNIRIPKSAHLTLPNLLGL